MNCPPQKKKNNGGGTLQVHMSISFPFPTSSPRSIDSCDKSTIKNSSWKITVTDTPLAVLKRDKSILVDQDVNFNCFSI